MVGVGSWEPSRASAESAFEKGKRDLHFCASTLPALHVIASTSVDRPVSGRRCTSTT